MELNEVLLDNRYWDDTYDKMISKQGFKKEDKEELLKLKEFNKKNIVEELLDGTYKWSIPRRVEIAKSGTRKKRVVYIYETKDRYILGVIYRALSSYYSDRFADNCFSYKQSVSTQSAIQYIKNRRTQEFRNGVKIDIHAYFNSVNREKVISMINELFSGGFKKTIEKLMINDEVYWDGNLISEWKALIPGCALGSFFANYCLRECDEYFNSIDCVYARYSDDIIILDKSKERLEEHLEKLLGFLEEYGLTMNPDKYTWFGPGDSVNFLGLKIDDNNVIDIADHSKMKIKKQIHRWCRKGRMEIERDYKDFDVVAKRVIRRINIKNFKCFINHDTTFGWCAYAFGKITTKQSLREIDNYTKDTLRAMKTGKHNKANYKAISDEEFKELGWVSLVDLYELYREDYDYYCEIIELL